MGTGARIVGACLALSLGACAHNAASTNDVSENFCTTRVDRSVLPLALPAPGQAEGLVARGLNADRVETAEVIGALGALDALVAAEDRGDGVAVLLARQLLHERVLLAMLDLQTANASLDCENERGDRLRGQLQRVDARRTRNLGLAGVLIGATTAAVSGGLSLGAASTASDIVGIVGGSAEAVAGGTVLFATTSGTLRTQTNLVEEVWRQPGQSTLFPATVWRYLTRRDEEGAANLADEIKAEWLAAGLIDDEDGLHALVLASEGIFTIDDLERRDAMLLLIEARVTLLNRDLRLLLEAIVARPAPAVDAVRGPARGGRTR
ncbi:MAG: hypothetical protein JWR10_2940 [Rubritepida sp.]|nr:hypothetical protein [Rubritepida sp.]